MTDSASFHRPVNWQRLRADQAQRIVRERATKTEHVFFSEHAFDRIAEREIIQEDAYWILQTGSVEGDPAFEDGEWKVVMVRRLPGKREAGVVTLFVRDSDELFVKTVEWMDWLR